MFAISITASASELRIIELQNRPAEQIQSLIYPLLAPEDRLVANGFQLLIRTSPGRYQEIEQLVKQLDTKLQNLMITVIQSRTLSAEQLNAGLNINIDTSNRDIDTYIKPHLDARNRHQQKQSNQRIRTLEGQPAYIESGETRSIQTSGYPTGNGNLRSETLIQAGTGFEVIPRLKGDDVILYVKPWSNRFKSDRNIQTQGLQTTITTRLGTWVEIGSSAQQINQNHQAIFSSTQKSANEAIKTLIKVDRI